MDGVRRLAPCAGTGGAIPQGARFEVRAYAYPVADCLPEVAALAADEWLQEHLGLPASGARAVLDPELLRHTFRWPHNSPFPEER